MAKTKNSVFNDRMTAIPYTISSLTRPFDAETFSIPIPDMPIYDPSRKPNKTPVARQLGTNKPLMVRHCLPPSPTWNYENPMARLSYGVMSAKESRSIRSLIELMSDGPLASEYIFPDTGFITTEIQDDFWNICDGRAIVFPEIIAAELSGWLQNPLHNTGLHSWLSRAIAKCEVSPEVQKPFRWGHVMASIGQQLNPKHVGVMDRRSMSEYGFNYYVDLLSIRKRHGIRVARQLNEKLGRPPEEVEMHNELQRVCDERIAPLGFKGWQDHGKRNFTADEELVVSAAINAVMTGQTSTILTRDNDVFEQFAKLMEALTGNYMCFYFGLARHFHSENVPMKAIPVNSPPGSVELFLGPSIENIVIPEKESRNLLPDSYTPVHCFCVLVGNTCDDPKVSIAGYCLEKEMQEMLFTKAITNGKNSSYFGNRNVVMGSNYNAKELSISFTIGEEASVDFEGIVASQIDILQSLRSINSVIQLRW